MSRAVAPSALALISVVLLALLSSAAHLETVFTVPLPPGEYYGSLRYEDVVYVLSANETVIAVNLTSRNTTWVSPSVTAYGYIESVGVSSQVLLLSLSDSGSFSGIPAGFVAVSTSTGELLWTASFQLSLPVTCFASGNWVYALVSANDQGVAVQAIQAFDLTTGAPGSVQSSDGLWIFGDTAFTIWGSELRAIDIPTNATLWTSTVGGDVLTANDKYVVIGNASNHDFPVVLHQTNGTVARAFNFIMYPYLQVPVAQFFDGNLLTVVGDDRGHYALLNVATGAVLWKHPYDYFSVICNTTLVTSGGNNTLHVVPIGGSAPAITISNVQSYSWAQPVDFGFGVVQVVNPQGYTLWDVRTGVLLQNNTSLHYNNTEPITPYKWEGISVTIFGGIVTGIKLVP